MSFEIITKNLCTDCKYCLDNSEVSLCKLNSELFNPNGLSECLLFKQREV